MSLSETRVDSLALAIANSGSWERMAYFLPLVRLLSNGHPVSLEQLAAALERPSEEVTEILRQCEDIVSDEQGLVARRTDRTKQEE
jgi:predicted transcriptional regulator